MNVKHLALTHGEKLIVGVAAVAVVVWMITASSDANLIAKNLTRESVQEDLDKVRRLREASSRPALTSPSDTLGRLQRALAQEVPAAPRMPWLTQAPDIGRKTGNKPYFYVYELHPVQIRAEDKVGAATLTLTLPSPLRPEASDGRVSDQARIDFVRKVGDVLTNRGRWLGVLLETRVGDGEWRPLNGPAIQSGGFLPIEKFGNGQFQLADLEPWNRHQFRARLLAAATGYNGTDSKFTMLVHAGSFANPGQNPQIPINEIMAGWPEKGEPGEAEKRQQILRRFIAPQSATSGGMQTLAGGEQLYQGPFGPTAEVTVSSDLRFGLNKVSPSATEGQFVGSFLVTQLMRMRGNDKSYWLDDPIRFNGLEIGAAVGGPNQKVQMPKGFGIISAVVVDLSTGFDVQALRANIERIWYYEISLKPRPNANRKGQKILISKPRVAPKAAGATLFNPRSGNTLDILSLQIIQASNGSAVATLIDNQGKILNSVASVYPAQFQFEYNEIEMFTKFPAEFTTYGLAPAKPIAHAAGTGPLLNLVNTPGATTDTDYFEMPDGRLIWLDDINNWSVKCWAPPGFNFPKAAAAAPLVPPPGPTTPASGAGVPRPTLPGLPPTSP